MVYFGIIIIPFILIFNAFCIGRIFKRINIIENSNLCTIIGFFTYISGIYLLSVILYLASSTVLVYGIIFLFAQVFLLALYGANWRYFFISWSINYKSFISFFLVLGLSLVICFLSMRAYLSPAAIEIIPIFEKINNPGWMNVINLSDGISKNSFYSNYNSLNIFNFFWVNVFKFEQTDLPLFINWYPAILISFLVANLSCYICSKTDKIYLMIINGIFSLMIVTFSLMFVETFFIDSAWILFFITCYLLILFSNNNLSLKLIFCAITIFGLEAISEGTTFVVICLYLFTIWYAVKTKDNIIQYVVFMFLPLSIEICWILIPLIGWFTLIILFVELILFTILLTLTLKNKYVFKITKANKWLSLNMKFFTYFFIIAVSITIVTFTIVFTKGNDFKTLFISSPFFNYNYLWNINLNMDENKMMIVNIAIFILYSIIFITALIYSIINKNYIVHAPEISLLILAFISTCNVFSISLMQYLNVIIMPDPGVNNWLMLCPVMLLILKMINCKQIKTRNWNYGWY